MPLNHYVYIFRAKDIEQNQNRAEIKTIQKRHDPDD